MLWGIMCKETCHNDQLYDCCFHIYANSVCVQQIDNISRMVYGLTQGTGVWYLFAQGTQRDVDVVKAVSWNTGPN